MSAQPSGPSRFCPLCEGHFDAAVCPVDGVPTVRGDFESAPPADATLGRVVAGRFKVERLLGQGAAGRVYAATQLSVGRPVALKLLQPHHAHDRHHIRRFYREARAATRLESRHVVRVYDYGVDDDTLTPFIAMELLRGETLRDRLRRAGPMLPADAARVGIQIARALAEADAAGIVHRDLKPANIMLVAEGDGGEVVVKVTDFGVAKDLGRDDTESLTQRGAAIGTPAYMAPEQVTGGDVSGKSDLYALGCVLHELVTGQPPFANDARARLLVDHLLTPAAPLPSPLPTGVAAPPELSLLLATLLAKSPADRPESAQAVAEALRAVIEAAEAAAAESSAAPPAGPAPRRASSPGRPGTLTSAPPARATAPASAARRRAWRRGLLAAIVALGAGAVAVEVAGDDAATPTAILPEVAAAAAREDPLAVRQLVVRGGAGTVHIHQGAARPLRIDGDPALVGVTQDEGQLTLALTPSPDPDAHLDVHLSTPRLDAITATGATSVVTDGPLAVEALSLGLTGSARATLELRAGALTTSLRGSSEATLRGRAARHDARIVGASHLAAGELATDATSITAAGTSEASLRVESSLDVRNEGAGEIVYRGNPAALTHAGRGIRHEE